MQPRSLSSAQLRAMSPVFSLDTGAFRRKLESPPPPENSKFRSVVNQVSPKILAAAATKVKARNEPAKDEAISVVLLAAAAASVENRDDGLYTRPAANAL